MSENKIIAHDLRIIRNGEVLVAKVSEERNKNTLSPEYELGLLDEAASGIRNASDSGIIPETVGLRVHDSGLTLLDVKKMLHGDFSPITRDPILPKTVKLVDKLRLQKGVDTIELRLHTSTDTDQTDLSTQINATFFTNPTPPPAYIGAELTHSTRLQQPIGWRKPNNWKERDKVELHETEEGKWGNYYYDERLNTENRHERRIIIDPNYLNKIMADDEGLLIREISSIGNIYYREIDPAFNPVDCKPQRDHSSVSDAEHHVRSTSQLAAVTGHFPADLLETTMESLRTSRTPMAVEQPGDLSEKNVDLLFGNKRFINAMQIAGMSEGEMLELETQINQMRQSDS